MTPREIREQVWVRLSQLTKETDPSEEEDVLKLQGSDLLEENGFLNEAQMIRLCVKDKKWPKRNKDPYPYWWSTRSYSESSSQNHLLKSLYSSLKRGRFWKHILGRNSDREYKTLRTAIRDYCSARDLL